jgi:hypothetical protein
LDDIFKKCSVYGVLRPELKELGKRNIDNWDKDKFALKSKSQLKQLSTTSLDESLTASKEG